MLVWYGTREGHWVEIHRLCNISCHLCAVAEKESQLAGTSSSEARLQADQAALAAEQDAIKGQADSLENAVGNLRRSNAQLDLELQQLKVSPMQGLCLAALQSTWMPPECIYTAHAVPACSW